MRKQDPWTVLTAIKPKEKKVKPVRQFEWEETTRIVRELIKLAETELPPFGFDIELDFQRTGTIYFWDNTAHGGFYGPKHKLILNLDWYEMAPEREIIHAVWHEMYHLYQWSQIEKLHDGKNVQESEETIQAWQYDMAHYKRMSKPAQRVHLEQKLEEDAYQFSFYMMMKYCPEDENDETEITLIAEKRKQFIKNARELFYQKKLKTLHQ